MLKPSSKMFLRCCLLAHYCKSARLLGRKTAANTSDIGAGQWRLASFVFLAMGPFAAAVATSRLFPVTVVLPARVAWQSSQPRANNIGYYCTHRAGAALKYYCTVPRSPLAGTLWVHLVQCCAVLRNVLGSTFKSSSSTFSTDPLCFFDNAACGAQCHAAILAALQCSESKDGTVVVIC